MTSYNITDFANAFQKLKLEEGDTVIIHCSLFKFGKPVDTPIKELPENIFKCIRKVIGDKGTIVVPTFNFEFCQGKTFDLQETESRSMGAFSEYIRKLPDSKRSFHPMQSVAVNGFQRDFLVEEDTLSSFSENGPFDKLVHLDTKILLLGTDFNSISMIHWVEERQKVPYRYWKSFRGNYIKEGKLFNKEYAMYVRDLEQNPILNLSMLENRMGKQNSVIKEVVGSGEIKVLNLRDFIALATKLLEENPYYFVSNHVNFLHL